jgi:hypothetical protein
MLRAHQNLTSRDSVFDAQNVYLEKQNPDLRIILACISWQLICFLYAGDVHFGSVPFPAYSSVDTLQGFIEESDFCPLKNFSLSCVVTEIVKNRLRKCKSFVVITNI